MQRYPHYSPVQLLIAFFDFFRTYDWSIPVEVIPTAHYPESPYNEMVWTRNQNQYDQMVILTPCFPAINSMRSATKSSMEVIREELNRGYSVCCGVMKGEYGWDTLFEEVLFEEFYPYYIQIHFSSGDAFSWKEWKGCVESK